MLWQPKSMRRSVPAYRHVAGCPACQDYPGSVPAGYLSLDADEVTCVEVRASAVRQVYRLNADRVRRHLVVCPACAVEERWLGADRRNCRSGRLVEPPRYPTFDLSFLPQPQSVRIWQQISAGVVRRLGYEIPAALALPGRSLASPLPGLTLSLAPSPAPPACRR